MRFVAIPLVLSLVTPLASGAQDRSRPPPPSAPATQPDQSDTPSAAQATSRPPRPPPPSSTSTPPRPPPPPGQGEPAPPPGPGGPWAPPPPPAYYPPPFWSGFGWGWGYYPIYPYYDGDAYPAYALPPIPPAVPATATMRVTGAVGTGDSSAFGLAFAVDGGQGGFDLAFDAFAPSQGGIMVGGMGGPMESYGFSTGHFAYPILSGPTYRLRLQAGGSWLSVPTSSYGGSTDSFGFDLGATGNLGLIGPLGLEGHARITPYPIQVVDLRAAVALRAGSFSLLGGYRFIDVAADSRTGPAARFEGPEFGLGFIF
jgi:hypothetical protein